MAELNELVSEQLFVIVAFLAVMVIFLLIIVLAQSVRLSRLRKRYERMMAGAGVEDLESLLLNLKMQTDSVEDEQEEQRRMMTLIEQRQRMAKTKLGIKRYNAFSDQGSDLSFSFALLDELDNGIVISGLHNRDSSYVYAKPLEQGESKYTLSPEEKEAIELARREGQR